MKSLYWCAHVCYSEVLLTVEEEHHKNTLEKKNQFHVRNIVNSSVCMVFVFFPWVQVNKKTYN